MNRDYPCYGLVGETENLNQGDFVRLCPVIVPPSPSDLSPDAIGSTIPVTVERYDVVVMSQTCDIVNEQIRYVLVCPYYTWSRFATVFPNLNRKSWRRQLEKGQIVRFHWLKECRFQGFESEGFIVNLGEAFSVSREFLVAVAQVRGPRLRVLPPYRERLAQRFGLCFMRVAIEE